MNRFIFIFGLIILVFLASLSLAGIPKMINYQGMLTGSDGKTPVNNGNYSILFSIYNTSSGGSSLWSHTYNVSVTNGLFNIILGDSGALINLPFDTTYWLGIKVGTDLELSPRIRLTSVGYAYRADTAGYALAGPWGGNNTWTFLISDGADTTLRTGGRWGIARYGNVLWGTADSTHVNFGVACTTGTSGQNYKYCTVGGGLANTANGLEATVGGGRQNNAIGEKSTVGGGYNNMTNGSASTIGGGWQNRAGGMYGTIGGGFLNYTTNYGATVGGGYNNWANDSLATAGGGKFNIANGKYSTIAGGYYNFAAGDYSAVLSGYADSITSSGDYSYLFGIKSKLTQDSTFMVDMPHIWFGKESNGYEFPTSRGTNGQVMQTDANGKLSWANVPGAGLVNDWSFLVSDGGDTTLRTAGRWGIARYGNTLYGNADSTHVNLGVACITGTNGQNYKYCTVGGGTDNSAGGDGATIAGGYVNNASGLGATVGGGESNIASKGYTTVGGGFLNHASGDGSYATVGGGGENTANQFSATVGGGWGNTASGWYATVGGGQENFVAGDYSAILGGYADTITNTAHFSYLFGIKGKLTDDSTFMVAMPYSRFDGNVQLNKNGGVLTLRTPTHDDASRYGIYFANNDLAPFMGDDGQDQDFDFYTGFASNRSYDAHVKVFGSATGSWGNYIELTHDGVDGMIKTDVGDIVLLPAGNVGIGTNIAAEKLDVNGKVYIETMDATSSGSLVRWYNKRLCSDASSARYKEDIQPLEDDFSKILQVQPKSFVDKTSGERNIGFIAEEFETLNLKNLVIHRDGQPEGIKYELISLYLLEVVKELKTKNEELQHRIETLEGKVTK